MKVLILVLASISVVHCGVLFGSNGLFGFDNEEGSLSTGSRVSAPASAPQPQPSFQRFVGAAGGQSGSFLPPSRPSNQYIPPLNPATSFQRPSQTYGAPSGFSGGSAPAPFNAYLPPSSGNFLPEQTAPPSNVYGAPNFADQTAPQSSFFGPPSQSYGAPDQSAPPSQLYGAPSQFSAPSQLYGAPNFGGGASGSGGFPTQSYLPPFQNSFPSSGGLSTNSAPVLSPPPAHGPAATPTKKVKTFRIIKETSSARAASPAKTIRIIKESRPHSDSGSIRTIRLVSDRSGSSSGSATKVIRIVNDGGDSSGHSSGSGETKVVRIVRDGSDEGGSSLGGAKILRILSEGDDSLSSSGSTRVLRLISDGSSGGGSSHSKTIRLLHDGGDSLKYAPGSGESDDGLLNIIKEHITSGSGSLSEGSEKVFRIVSDGSNSDSSSSHKYISGLGDSGSEKILRIVS